MAQMARLVSLLLMGAVIVMLALTFYHVIAPFLMPLFLAGVLAVLCQPLYRRILKWTKDRTAVAAGLTSVAVLIIVLVPATLVTGAAASQLYHTAQQNLRAVHLNKSTDWNELLHRVRDSSATDWLIAHYEEWTGETVDRDELQSDLQNRLRQSSLVLARKTLGYAGGSALSLLGIIISILIGGRTVLESFFFFLFAAACPPLGG